MLLTNSICFQFVGKDIICLLELNLFGEFIELNEA